MTPLPYQSSRSFRVERTLARMKRWQALCDRWADVACRVYVACAVAAVVAMLVASKGGM